MSAPLTLVEFDAILPAHRAWVQDDETARLRATIEHRDELVKVLTDIIEARFFDEDEDEQDALFAKAYALLPVRK